MTDDVTHVRLDRWSGGLAAAVVLAAFGIVDGSPVLFVAAAVPVVYVLYGSLDRVALDPESLSVDREMERESAFPGDRIDVRVRITNDGDRPLADLRVVDGVPGDLSVVDGHPREALTLRPGETATVEYTVVARRGDHGFGPVRIRARSTSGTDVVTVDATAEGASTLTCRPDIDGVPLARQTQQFAGSIGTDSGGTGVEFHSTREYRRGDPVSRIDWRRLAKSGDLTTIDYREHRSARVVVAVDARDPCYVAPEPGAPTGAAMCSYGARRVFDVLRAAGHEVGAAGFGLPDRMGTVGPAWVRPGGDDETRLRAHDLFEAAAETPDHLIDGPDRRPRGVPPRPEGPRDPTRDRRPDADRADVAATDGGPPHGDGPMRPVDGEGAGGDTDGDADPGDPIDSLCERLSAETQVLLFTPALDRFPEDVVRRVRAHGHRITVVSPDVTSDDSTGGRLHDVERSILLEDLRAAEARVIDWERDRPLALTLASVLEGI